MRLLIALIIAVSVSGQPGPARAMDIPEAITRLAAIDNELTTCLRARFLTAVIVVRALRDCIDQRRPDEASLRRDLNDWISTLAGDDPERVDALEVRVDLNALRGFMNQLAAAFRDLPERVELSDAELTVARVCNNRRAALQGAEFVPATGYRRRSMCLPD